MAHFSLGVPSSDAARKLSFDLVAGLEAPDALPEPL
jgi:hypothetical protein